MVLQYNDSMGPAAGEEINGGRGEGGEGAKTVLPKSKMKKVPICVMACVRVCTVYEYAERPRGVSGQCGFFFAGSLSAAGGSTGLVQAHGFAQPAGKVHFLNF